MMTRRSFHTLVMMALVALVTAFLPGTTQAQVEPGEGPRTTEIRTNIQELPDSDFPLSVDYNYDGGDTKTLYLKNDAYKEPGAQGKGELKSVTVFGKVIPVGGRAQVVTPSGLSITVTVTVDVYVFKDGSVLVVVTVTISNP